VLRQIGSSGFERHHGDGGRYLDGTAGRREHDCGVVADAVTREHAFSSIAASGAEIVWIHESGLVAALKVGPDASRAPLYRSGAILVGATAAPCLAWSKT